jgi:hypothetical protein
VTLALPPWIGLAIGWTVSLAALWTGGRSERAVALGFLASWFTTALTKDRAWSGLQWGGFVGDALFLALLLCVALRSRKYWPLFAAAFQLLAVVTHAALLIDNKVGAWAYITAGVIWTYLLLFALAFGTWGSWRERQLAKVGLATEPGAMRR